MKLRFPLVVLALSCLLPACLHVAEPAATALRPAEFPVIGYWASWRGDLDAVRGDGLTQVNYSFGTVKGDGSITKINAKLLRRLVAHCHSRGIRVFVALGGWGGEKGFVELTGKPEPTAALIANCVKLCEQFQLDGIDIDWEYPGAREAVAFESWMRQLSQALHARGRLLSTAVISHGDTHGAHILPGVFEAVDQFNLMAYDAYGKAHGDMDEARLALDYWVGKRGVPREKAILGLPFYGRDSSRTYAPYRKIVSDDPAAAQRDLHGSIAYNGIPMMKAKVALAQERAGGVMIWELSDDTKDAKSLLQAIGESVRKP
jgi:GH18 family chitinase